jgi:hypothetical protein
MKKISLCVALLIPLMSACSSDTTSNGTGGTGGSSGATGSGGDSSSGGGSSTGGASSSTGGASASGGSSGAGSGGESATGGAKGSGGKDGGEGGTSQTGPDAGNPDSGSELPGDGGVHGKDPCCTTHLSLGCNEPSIQDCVCKASGGDPRCCTEKWNAVCVALVGSLGCGTTCKQDCCTTASTPGCADPTIQACVCKKNAPCCSTAWDGFCTDLVGQNVLGGTCGATCS